MVVGLLVESFLREGSVFSGGSEVYTFELARLGRDVGADIRIYQPGRAADEQEVEGIRVSTVPCRAEGISREGAAQAVRDGCTIIHFPHPARARALPGRRSTSMFHGVNWDVPYDARFAKWYPLGWGARFYLPLWRRRQLRATLGGLYRCHQVLCGDTALLHIVQSLLPELRSRLYYCPNFASLPERASDHVEPLRAARSDGRVVVLVPRNLSLARGGAWLREIAQCVDDATDGGCVLFVAGGFPETYGRQDVYRKLLTADALPRNLHLLGSVPHEEMAALYRAADIVLIPTFFCEGGSLSAIEAMWCGVPVVATAVGGLSDLVTDGVTGHLSVPEIGEIARAVVNLAGDAGLRRRMGRRARVEAHRRYALAAWRQRMMPFLRMNGWI